MESNGTWACRSGHPPLSEDFLFLPLRSRTSHAGFRFYLPLRIRQQKLSILFNRCQTVFSIARFLFPGVRRSVSQVLSDFISPTGHFIDLGWFKIFPVREHDLVSLEMKEQLQLQKIVSSRRRRFSHRLSHAQKYPSPSRSVVFSMCTSTFS